jgi:hypothetical protein
MNITLSTFMKIAVTVIVIVASLWNMLVPQMGDISDDISTYIESNS